MEWSHKSDDPDTNRIWWRDGGVHQNITHAVQPDPISGAHCWLQKVRLSVPNDGEEYGDIEVDRNKSFEYYKRWNEWAKDRGTSHPRRTPTIMDEAASFSKETALVYAGE